MSSNPAETPKRRDHRRPEPRARARDAEGGRLHRCRSAQADHRRREHLDRDRPVQLPPAHAGRAREGRHPQGRRHADGVQHRVDLRRHHDGQPGDEDVAHQPRSDCRFDRARRARQHVRRPHRAVRLRQDDSRHHHGARAPRYPRRHALRRVDRARRVPRKEHHHSGRVRGRGRARRRPHVGRRSADRREPGAEHSSRIRSGRPGGVAIIASLPWFWAPSTSADSGTGDSRGRCDASRLRPRGRSIRTRRP